jgi:hypothetical protein
VRLEYKGTIEVAPPFQHVGYVAAAVNAGYRGGGPSSLGLFGLALAFVIVAAGLWIDRRIRTRAGLVAAYAALGMGLALALAAGVYASVRPAPPFYKTLYRLEQLSATTDGWARTHGRLPSEQEWSGLIAPAERTDGWGYPFRYRPLPKAASDGQMFAITSLAERYGPDPHLRPGRENLDVRDIPSSWLGRDGVFGTPDDDKRLRDILAPAWVLLRSYEHGRLPRK